MPSNNRALARAARARMGDGVNYTQAREQILDEQARRDDDAAEASYAERSWVDDYRYSDLEDDEDLGEDEGRGAPFADAPREGCDEPEWCPECGGGGRYGCWCPKWPNEG